ncbi:lacZ [Symbiodinium pilosum]|uniref:LacZ protein n=1 Tax=Symbiodinium pilosum TaxID=2952 RepID=A0A812MKI7_SYMPI|nr:lacZ [Symbiodinium pilosum]
MIEVSLATRSTTFILLSRGASFARLPSPAEEVEMDQAARVRLLEALARLGGYPERCGICIAAEDTVSEGSERRFRLGASLTQHALALDRRPWDDLHVSPLEMEELFARDVANARQVLLLRGALAPEDKQLQKALRFAASVRAVTAAGADFLARVSTSSLLAALDDTVAEVAGLPLGAEWRSLLAVGICLESGAPAGK